jgi:hypothetical protein
MVRPDATGIAEDALVQATLARLASVIAELRADLPTTPPEERTMRFACPGYTVRVEIRAPARDGDH